MICSETREYLFAFLDSELDAPLSIELQRHSERCHDCAREVEIERTIHRQLSANLDALSAGYALDEGALKLSIMHTPRDGVETLKRRNVETSKRRNVGAALLAAAAAILIVFTSMWIIGPRSDSSRLGERFALLVVDDFQHFMDKGQELQIASADPGIVTDWLRERTKLDFVLPALDGSGCRLLGGRKCKIEGHIAAFAVFEVAGLPASLVAVAGEGWNLEGMTRVGRVRRPDAAAAPDVGPADPVGAPDVGPADPTYWVDSCKGYTVVVWRRGGLTYAAVSRVSKEKLLSLMAGALHEGD